MLTQFSVIICHKQW